MLRLHHLLNQRLLLPTPKILELPHICLIHLPSILRLKLQREHLKLRYLEWARELVILGQVRFAVLTGAIHGRQGLLDRLLGYILVYYLQVDQLL